ncbi:uncharacterized protein LOC106174182 [Lingula anatina]|uniref:Uncharacterized protein LOC106174182 n=1 Tax=Lingula anatina TaxID=7574 RepID=A0A1S3JMC5_LINAN|nr:uncharacterized protein LOC106174182 [Lingula anatina]|eukprot:XP_013411059.1 uncharacterized protein LOC106174182 [Lingula anatina]
MVSTATQCEIITAHIHTTNNEAETEDNSMDDDISRDPNYEPYSEEDSELEDEAGVDSKEPLMCRSPEKEKKIIVFESCLLQLLNKCKKCSGACTQYIAKRKGTFESITTWCQAGHKEKWASQPVSSSLPWGNLLLSAAILYSGSSPSQALRMMCHANILTVSRSTYGRIQSAYLIPTIYRMWQDSQQELINERRNTSLTLGGDARCDTPGYSAKYGSYTMMDVKANKVLDVQLVQCNEVKGSTHMELEGLKRGVEFLQEQGMTMDCLITDRHVQVRKYMREENPEKQHLFDVFHVAKGVEKKLEAAAKKRGQEIRPWIKSIVNHMYWVAATAERKQPKYQQEKWLSILNHTVDIHQGH